MREDISGENQRGSVDRKQLTRLMLVLFKGDVLVVTRLDRLPGPHANLLIVGDDRRKGCGVQIPAGAWLILRRRMVA